MLTRRQFLKKCTLTLAASLAAPFLAVSPPSGAAGELFPIPVYHRVGDKTDPLTLAPGRFAADLQYLADNGYRTVTAGRLKDYILDGRQLPAKAVFLTFDDGYADNYAAVFPLLLAHGMTACFFVISGLCGQPDRLSGSQIREMSAAGMDFGSHTVSHRPLASLEKWENALELVKSKTDIEDILGKEAGVVAYPYGSYSADTLEAARDAGYWGGLTTRTGFTDIAGSELAMNRIPIFRHGRGLAHHLS